MQFNNLEMTKEQFLAKLKERLATANIDLIRQDILPFIKNPQELDIWSNDYFLQLAEMVQFE